VTISEAATILRQLLQINGRLDEQALEMTILRNALDVQFKRIADLQAQLDVLPSARRRRAAALTLVPPSRPSPNGNGTGSR
jgi:hypothetical protein